MERACRWEMGSYCSRLLDFATVPTFDSIREHVPLLQSWDPQSDDTASLMRALRACSDVKYPRQPLLTYPGFDCLVSAEQVRLLVPPLYIFGEGAGRAK